MLFRSSCLTEPIHVCETEFLHLSYSSLTYSSFPFLAHRSILRVWIFLLSTPARSFYLAIFGLRRIPLLDLHSIVILVRVPRCGVIHPCLVEPKISRFFPLLWRRTPCRRLFRRVAFPVSLLAEFFRVILSFLVNSISPC